MLRTVVRQGRDSESSRVGWFVRPAPIRSGDRKTAGFNIEVIGSVCPRRAVLSLCLTQTIVTRGVFVFFIKYSHFCYKPTNKSNTFAPPDPFPRPSSLRHTAAKKRFAISCAFVDAFFFVAYSNT